MELEIAGNQTEVIIKSAILTSDRTGEAGEVDIARIITDLTIYEHITKPYVTADIMFLDQINLLQDLDFQGGEKLSITLIHSENRTDGYEIKKDFLIDYIRKITKTDERNETVMAHCTEYTVLESSVQNVSRSYTGAPTNIIKKIANEYLSKSVQVSADENITDMKVVIPNLHPLEAAMWIKDRANSSIGLPYYFYSALALDNLILKDLGTMLSQNPINLDKPYVYAPSLQMTAEAMQRFYNVDQFAYESTDNLLRLIREGLVGAEYQFIDTLTATRKKVEFKVDDDAFFPLAKENLLGGANSRFVYAPDYKVQGINLSNYNSKVISQLSSSGAYLQKGASFKSYNDDVNPSDHKRKIVGKALKHFLAKSPISITVKGREFLTGDANYTIGQTIRIVFLDNDASAQGLEQRPVIDTKKSGDYIICEAKHVIKLERYDVVLVCGKLASFGEEVQI